LIPIPSISPYTTLFRSMSAQRFHEHTTGVPSVEEVDAFINSGEWVDMFVHVKKSFVGPYGLSLKTVAPQAGFFWEQGDFDGEESDRKSTRLNSSHVSIS